MRWSARSSLAALKVAACSATSGWNTGRDPKLDFALHGRAMQDEEISRVGAGHEQHARAPGLEQIAVRQIPSTCG